MWGTKVRKLVDICVFSAIGVSILAIGGGVTLKHHNDYKKYSENFDAQERAAKDAMRDEFGHIPSPLKAVVPTETSVGYTIGTKCLECGEIYKGHKEIPMLTEEHYDRIAKQESDGILVTWKLKDEFVEELGNLSYPIKYTKGYANVEGSYYLAPEFNKEFDGIEMFYDESTSSIVFNVTKQGGYTLNCKYFKVDSSIASVKFMGEPLTIITDGSQNALDLNYDTCNLTVENELDIHVAERINTSVDKSGVLAHKIVVGPTGCLRSSNYRYGIYTKDDIDVNGQLDVSGVNSAIYYSSSINNEKYVNVADGHNLYVKEAKKTLTNSRILEKDCGKHLSICVSTTDVKDFISYKLVKVTAIPTDSSTGSANFVCVGCETTSRTISLPKLNDTDYGVKAVPTKIDGEIKPVNCYTYHVDEIYTDDLVFDKRDDLVDYFIVGDSYYTVQGWKDAYSNAPAEEIENNTFKITLTGNVTFNLGDTGSIDFTKYDKVIIEGTGTFKVVTNQKTALIAKSLEVGKNVILSLDGTNCSKPTYVVDDRDGGFDGIVAAESLVIKGKINITNFYVGILTNGACSIGATAEITITNTIYGVYSNAATTLTSNGKLTFTNTASATKYTTAVGLYSYRSAVTYHFTGNSETTITTGNQGLGTVDSNSANNVTLRASGSAKVTLRATNTGTTNYAVSNINHFIVANDNDAECNATVSLIANSSAAMNYLSSSSANHSFIVNSTGDVVLWKDGSKVSQNGVNFNAGKYDFKILSNVKIQRFDYAMNFSSVTVKSAVCDHKVVTNVPNFACNHNFKGTLPAGITEAGWIYTE